MSHANARLNQFGRKLIAQRVLAGHKPGEVAKQAGVPVNPDLAVELHHAVIVSSQPPTGANGSGVFVKPIMCFLQLRPPLSGELETL